MSAQRPLGQGGASASKRGTTRRGWGYLVWLIAAGVILIPECIAAFAAGSLPFPTISKMTGHLESEHDLLRLVVVALLIWVAYSTIRVPPVARSGQARTDGDVHPARTAGGRLTLHRIELKAPETFDDEPPARFWAWVSIALAIIALAGFAVANWWDDGRPHYRVAYVLYGLIGLLWIIIPSLFAFALGKDVPFPTFFRSVANLEDWLARQTWKQSLGPALAWIISYLILTGLVILLLHLTFYPFPHITLSLALAR